jgi:hypothetical protein
MQTFDVTFTAVVGDLDSDTPVRPGARTSWKATAQDDNGGIVAVGEGPTIEAASGELEAKLEEAG